MLHLHATPRAFLFIGRLAELAALTAAAPARTPLFRSPDPPAALPYRGPSPSPPPRQD